jgi:hypothetical protein
MVAHMVLQATRYVYNCVHTRATITQTGSLIRKTVLLAAHFGAHHLQIHQAQQ